MSKKVKKPAPIAVQIHSVEMLRTEANRLIQLKADYAVRKAKLDKEIAELTAAWDLQNSDLALEIDAVVAGLHIYALSNRASIFTDEKKSLDCGTATIGFAFNPPAVALLVRKDSWEAAAIRAGQDPEMMAYLKETTPSLDKEAILTHRADLPEAVLRRVGLVINQEERFFIKSTFADVQTTSV
jgi:phage host-nuclease inhibitor protein Gam